MKVVEAVARVLKAEGVEHLICYPRQALIDACAAIGIKPVVCRQERIGAGIADGISRSTYGRRVGIFAMRAALASRTRSAIRAIERRKTTAG